MEWRWARMLVWIAGAAVLGGCAMGGAERAPRSTGMGRLSVVDIGPLGLEQVEGTVEEVDANEGTLVIRRPNGDLRLETGKHTSIYVEGGVAGLRDIEEGALVRASFSMESGDPIAMWIEVPRPEEKPENEHAPNPVDAPPPDLSAPPGGRAP